MAGAMRTRVRWHVTPDQVRRAFDGLANGLGDWTPAMSRLNEIFAGMFGKIFGSGGGALDSPWAPITPETLRRKMRAGGEQSRATLHATGALEASLTGGAGTTGAIRRIVSPGQGLPRFEWGTSLPYASALQKGSAKRGIPARPFVGLTDEAQEEITEVLQGLLDRRLRETAEALGGNR